MFISIHFVFHPELRILIEYNMGNHSHFISHGARITFVEVFFICFSVGYFGVSILILFRVRNERQTFLWSYFYSYISGVNYISDLQSEHNKKKYKKTKRINITKYVSKSKWRWKGSSR